MKPRSLHVVSTIAILLAATARGEDREEKDRLALLQRVAEIAAPGVPGPLVVVDDDAFVVVAGQAERGISAPVVAAGKLGSGRVVVFGHSGYGDAETLKTADTGKLVANAIRWAARRSGTDGEPRIGAFDEKFVAALGELGLSAARRLADKTWPDTLNDYDALCIPQRKYSDAEIAAIRKFAQAGGGLIASGLGWGWLQLNPGQDLHQHPLNRILEGSGIFIADGTLDRTSKDGYACDKPISPYCHAARAVDVILNLDRARLTKDALRQASWSATAALRALPADDKLIRPKLTRLMREHAGDLVPSEKNPIKSEDGLARLLLTMQVEDLRSLSADKVKAHPAAREFPGEVPKDAREVARKIEVDCSIPDWHGTGLYAAPGQVVRIELPDAAIKGQLGVRIGAHKDELWDKDKWSRVPEITLETPLKSAKTTIASAFGGPIYLVVPKDCKLGTIEVTIAGAVEMPHFVLDKTSLDDWKKTIRARPAPWGELETSKVILTLPSRVLRNLDDPESLMRFWDRILDAHATLATIPLKRERPERMVADVQISAGYMHSGYPIMTHLDVDTAFVNLEGLRRGEKIWGFVHELGHNHQVSDWTFDGTGEVTCNLFSLHVIDTVCQPPPGKRGHEAVDDPPKVAEYLARGAKFDEWKREPFLALHMYVQLQKEFGWETFKKVFAEYRALAKEQRPKNQDEERDQWMVRFSRACGRNLGPFFVAWGVPTSEAARQSIADLPAWMPADFPK